MTVETGHDLQRIDGSGATKFVGYHSSVCDDGAGVCTLDIGPNHLNRSGLLHGGFLSMLIDNGCGVAVRSAIGDLDAATVTTNLTVNFIAAVSSGRVIAIGRVIGGGRVLKFAECEIHDEAGNLVATGNATYRLFDKEERPGP